MKSVLVAIVVLLFSSVLGATQSASIRVVQLDGANLPPSLVAELPGLLAPLNALLADPTLGPQRKLGQDGWTTAQFARFTAGSLAERGYDVQLATTTSGGAWCVLVGIRASNRTVWVPIEPSPSGDAVQLTLGRIPFVSPGSASLLLVEPYLSFTSATTLPANVPPTALPPTASVPAVNQGDMFQLLAGSSHDTDGTIALYRWCIGNQPCASTTSWSYTAIINDAGQVVVRLSVVDNDGRSASSAFIMTVLAAPGRPAPVTPPPCGC